MGVEGLVKRVAQQFRRPEGRLGKAVAAFLNVVNRRLNRAAIDALELAGHEAVCDVGFGGGVGLREVLDRLATGTVTGIDLSADMVRRAREKFTDDIGRGRLDVREGSVDALPAQASSFDAVYTANTVYFWPDLARGMAEIARVTRPGGRLVVAVAPSVMRHPRITGFDPPPPERIAAAMSEAGFEVETRTPGRDIVLVVGRRPEDERS